MQTVLTHRLLDLDQNFIWPDLGDGELGLLACTPNAPDRADLFEACAELAMQNEGGIVSGLESGWIGLSTLALVGRDGHGRSVVHIESLGKLG